jgi:IS5 family transposase
MKQDSPYTQQLSFLAPNLMDQLNPKHPLLQLAKRIPWEYFELNFPSIMLIPVDPQSPFG